MPPRIRPRRVPLDIDNPRVEEATQHALWRDARDLDIAMARLVADQSAALSRVDPKLNGRFCEFGVWKG